MVGAIKWEKMSRTQLRKILKRIETSEELEGPDKSICRYCGETGSTYYVDDFKNIPVTLHRKCMKVMLKLGFHGLRKERPGKGDEWFKEATIGAHMMRTGVENLLKDRYKIKAKVTRTPEGQLKILASAHTEDEKKRFEKFLDELSTPVIKQFTVHIYVKD